MKTLKALRLPTGGPELLDYLPELHSILDGSTASVPVSDDARFAATLTDALDVGGPIAEEISLVISTSGTTGVPKGAQHTPETLASSARSTARHLGGEGNWLLALAPHHIAGLQVLLRAIAAGHRPAVLDVRDGFDAGAFAAAIDTFDGPRRYTSLVPTQLIKVLDSPRATAALRTVDAVLVGGAVTPIRLQRRAIDAGLPITCTYGMSETAGGCVYDGVPLDGVRVRIENPDAEGVGRVLLGGPMIAHGYRNRPEHPAFADTGWFRTDDLGSVDTTGALAIVGRADEAISTGGLTIVPQVVEAVIDEDPAVAECAVVGLPDERLGEKVVVFVVAANGTTVDAERIRGAVAERLERHAAPREVIELDALPMRGPGKVDRRALRHANPQV